MYLRLHNVLHTYVTYYLCVYTSMRAKQSVERFPHRAFSQRLELRKQCFIKYSANNANIQRIHKQWFWSIFGKGYIF